MSEPGRTDSNRPGEEGGSDLSNYIDGLSVRNNNKNNNRASSSPVEPRQYELLHQSETTRIFRCNEQGVKVLIDPNLSLGERLELLQSEQRISSRLPSSCSQRKVLGIENEQSNHGMFFEWVDGVTAYEWLRPDADTPIDSSGVDLTSRLQVALAITKAVCDFHQAGVFHCNLSLQNVVISFNEESDACTATLIDYSKAVVPSDHPSASRDDCIKEQTRKDLNDLGLIIYSVLSNHMPLAEAEEDASSEEEAGREEEDEEEDDNVQRRVRGRRQQIEPTINLPVYLLSLVSSLLSPSINQEGDIRYSYTNARSVLSDLQLADDRPDIYMKFHGMTDLVTNPLIMPKDPFYGRRIELGMLQHSFDAMMEGSSKPCVLLVSGYAGAG